MNRCAGIVGIAATTLFLCAAKADTPEAQPETVSIPLDRIWAYEMPGTRDVGELEPKLDVHSPDFKGLYERSLVRKIASYLSTYAPNQGETCGPAFVVVGTGKVALQEAYSELVKDRGSTRNSAVTNDEELTIVFYSYVTGWHLRLKSVDRSSSVITIKYQFVAPQEPAFAAKRFALIPIGKLPKGSVEVKIEQMQPVDYRGRAMPPKKDADRFVCGSFSFDVK